MTFPPPIPEVRRRPSATRGSGRRGWTLGPAVIGLVLPVAFALSAILPPAGPWDSDAQQLSTLAGTLHVVWDGELEPASDGRRFFVVDAEGNGVELVPGDGLASDGDALEALDRRAVVVSGPTVRTLSEPGGAAIRVSALRATDIAQPAGAVILASSASVADRDFVTILCAYSDVPPPFTVGEVEPVHGATYPGMTQYYAETSRDPATMAGNTVVGWYTLPSPRATYVTTSTDVGLLAKDCTAAADDDVDFSQFYGVNIQVSGPLHDRPTAPFDPLSLGGSYTLQLDGVSRTFGMTWLSSDHYQNYVVVTHEMGHALGWPHSSGRYGEEYDSRWDVMSVGYLRNEPPWGWLTIHTIAHHKLRAGWIPDDRRWLPAQGTTETATIVRSALPPDDGYLMAVIPTGTGTAYTVEARMEAGHDRPLPAEAVVIHETEGARAYVVDPDLNGDPNDEGAIWRPGETFTDSENGVSVAVEEQVGDGFRVTITRSEGICAVSLSAAPAEAGTAQVVGGGQTGPCGREVTVEATAGEGWLFTGWATDGLTVSTDTEYTFTATSNLSLVATFARRCTVQTVADPAAGGSASVSKGTEDGACGRSVTVSAAPSTGWLFVDWKEAGFVLSTESSYAFPTTGNHTLTAGFADASDVGGRALRTLFGVSGLLAPSEIVSLDRDGNRSGSFDLGDMLALLDRNPSLDPKASR